jgi:metallopeptidase MepB
MIIRDWDYGYASRLHSIFYPGTVTTYILGFCIAELIWDSVFANDPMSKDAGMLWRREVFEPGGTMKPLDMIENVIGERPSVDSLCKEKADLGACESIPALENLKM